MVMETSYSDMTRVDARNRAIFLRKEGLSYSEIQKELNGISKSTLSGWLRNVVLSKEQEVRLRERYIQAGKLGRLKGSMANREKSERRIREIQVIAAREFIEKSKDPLFLIGVALYWAEGNQKTKRFQFTNSNPKMINLMMVWLRDICEVGVENISFRLYIHEIYKKENNELFW